MSRSNRQGRLAWDVGTYLTAHHAAAGAMRSSSLFRFLQSKLLNEVELLTTMTHLLHHFLFANSARAEAFGGARRTAVLRPCHFKLPSADRWRSRLLEFLLEFLPIYVFAHTWAYHGFGSEQQERQS